MKTKLKVLLTGAAVAGMLFVALPAQAAQMSSPEPISPANSYLATPDELEILGLDQATVDAQQLAWSGLTNAQRDAQNTLRAAQIAAKQDLATVPVHHLGAQPGTVSPMTVYPQSCLDAPNGYKLGKGSVSSSTYTCYIGVGVFDYGASELAKVVSIRPGNESGRVLYHYNATYYWSVDRGPNDFSTYYFDLTYGSIYVKSVQLY
jgi:hypothetical protein